MHIRRIDKASKIMGWIYFILVLGFLIYVLIWNIIKLFYTIKDHRFLKQNRSPENYFKYYYNKYIEPIETPTEENVQLLRDILAQLKDSRQAR